MTGEDGYTTHQFPGSDGMTLRQYYAAKALQGFWSQPPEQLQLGQTQEQFREEMCGHFYAWADAMIAEGEK